METGSQKELEEQRNWETTHFMQFVPAYVTTKKLSKNQLNFTKNWRKNRKNGKNPETPGETQENQESLGKTGKLLERENSGTQFWAMVCPTKPTIGTKSEHIAFNGFDDQKKTPPFPVPEWNWESERIASVGNFDKNYFSEEFSLRGLQ